MSRADAGGDLALLALLQLTDSAFPSGAYTLSYGVETLIAEGAIRGADDLGRYVRSCLRHRMARAELPALLAAADTENLETIVEVDRRLDSTKLAAEDRGGSARVGRRLLVEARRLVDSPLAGSRLVGEFGDAVNAGRSPGHAAVAFGVVGRAFGNRKWRGMWSGWEVSGASLLLSACTMRMR